MSTFRFRTLGGVEVRLEGSEEPVPLHRRQLALLALLAASPRGSLSRDRILALLWEESDETKARDSLKQAVHAIRSSLRDDAVITELDELRLNLGAVLVDVEQVASAVRADRYEEVVALYGGPFLDGFNLPRAGEFAHWADGERARYAQLWRKSMESIANAAEQRGEYALAAERWRTLAMADPLDATLARAVVRSLARDQNVPAALQYAKTYEARLRDELGVEPDAAFRELVAAVSSGMQATSRRHAAAPTSEQADHDAGLAATLGGTTSVESAAGGRGDDIAAETNEPTAARILDGRTVRRSRLLMAGAIATLAIAGSAYAAWSRRAASRLDPRQFYVSALSVAPDDSSLRTLGLLAHEQLELGISQFGSIRLIDVGLAPPASAGVTQASDLAAARAALAGTVVRGTIRRLGDTLVLSAAIVDVNTGALRSEVDPVYMSVEHPVEAAVVLRDRLVALMGLELDDERFSQLDAGSSLPHSLAAYELFRQAEDVYYRGYFDPAFALASRAYALDTTFVRVLMFAAHVQQEMGNCAFHDSITEHLRAPAVVLKPLDRIYWERDGARCRGDYRSGLALAEELLRLRPASAGALAGVAFSSLSANRPNQTLAIMKRADPLLNSPSFVLLAGGPFLSALHALGRHRDELSFAHHFEELNPNDNEGFAYEILALAALGQGSKIVSVLSTIAQIPSGGTATAGDIGRAAAGELRVHGDSAEAMHVLKWTEKWYQSRLPEEQRTSTYRAHFAAALADAGDVASADSVVKRLCREDPRNIGYRGMAGVLAARLGDTASAHAADRWLAEQPPQPEGERSLWRARIAARLGDVSGAFILLRSAVAEGLTPTPIFFRTRIHIVDDLAPLRATQEFAVLMKPAG